MNQYEALNHSISGHPCLLVTIQASRTNLLSSMTRKLLNQAPKLQHQAFDVQSPGLYDLKEKRRSEDGKKRKDLPLPAQYWL